MTAEALKISFLFYLKNLALYDYLAFGWFIVTFFILIFLAILLARKSTTLALLLIITSLVLFILAPFMIKWKLNHYLRPVTTEVTHVQKLIFSDSLIVEGEITNKSSKSFQKCLVETNILKNNPSNIFVSYINLLKPLKNRSILLESVVFENNVIEYRVVFDDFFYEGDITATIKAECY